MASTEVDDTDSLFDYKDDAWTSGGQTGDLDGTSHSTDTAGAQVIFGPFTGAPMQRHMLIYAILNPLFTRFVHHSVQLL